MSYIMAAQMGLSLVNTAASFASSSIEAGLSDTMQKYRNTVAALQAARQQNAVEINAIRERRAEANNLLLIEKTSIRDQGIAEVQAAAAGVEGNSVDAVMRDLKASAINASYEVKKQSQEAQREFAEQKRTININRIVGESREVIPRPSPAMAVLGLGTQALNIYNSHQPESQRLF